MSLFEIAVDQNDVKRLGQRMYSMDDIEVDLINVDFIETFYNIIVILHPYIACFTPIHYNLIS
jgi:hypothetical protein